ncbi:methyltransferase dimerization domain-containing protein [Clostridiaceae bacterium M8S5]|nr:methyltransferase dimerization domain-containing protein [Clostridiaceae bacterium M8S5]
MKPIVDVKKEYRYLFNIREGELRKKLLFSAIELDLFTHLEEFKSAKEIAEEMNYNIVNTEHILNALTSIDLLEKKSGKFKNSEIANSHLSRNSDGFAGDLIIDYDSAIGLNKMDIVKSVKEGASIYNGKDGFEALKMYEDYTTFLIESQRIGRAKEFCDVVKQLPEFKDFKKMLDLGGGAGLIGICIGQEKEDIEGVIFDTPNSINVTKRCIKEYNIEDRFTTIAGNYQEDDIGYGYDLVLAIGTLNFAKDNLDIVTKKIYDSLNDKGVFISISDGITDDGTKPVRAILTWLPAVLQGIDFYLEQGQVSKSALNNGFSSVSRKTIEFLNAELDVDILRK